MGSPFRPKAGPEAEAKANLEKEKKWEQAARERKADFYVPAPLIEQHDLDL